MIKIQIYNSGLQFSNKALYTHDIGNLIIYAKSVGVELRIPKYIEENSMSITDWEAGSRYDIHFSIRVDTLDKYLDLCTKWLLELKRFNNNMEWIN